MVVEGAADLAGSGVITGVPLGVVTIAGNVSSSHWTLTLTATATSVKFVNAEEDEPPLVLTGVTIGHELVVDGLSRTVTDNGTAAPGMVAAGSGWPALVPGTNSLTVIGATGTLSYHPLYA